MGKRFCSITIFLIFLFLSCAASAEERNYCKLTEKPYSLREGESEFRLTEDALIPNQREGEKKVYNCWLPKEEIVVIDDSTGKITRVKKCSNFVIGNFYIKKEVPVESVGSAKKHSAPEQKTEKCGAKMMGVEKSYSPNTYVFVGKSVNSATVGFQYSQVSDFSNPIETDKLKINGGEAVDVNSFSLQSDVIYHVRMVEEKDGDTCYSAPIAFLMPAHYYPAKKKNEPSKIAVALHCAGGGLIGYGLFVPGGDKKVWLIAGGAVLNVIGYFVDSSIDSADLMAAGGCAVVGAVLGEGAYNKGSGESVAGSGAGSGGSGASGPGPDPIVIGPGPDPIL